MDHIPSKSVQKTPYRIWTGKSSVLSFVNIWRCECTSENLFRINLIPNLRIVYLSGILKEIKGYKFHNPEENEIFIVRIDTFSDEDFKCTNFEFDAIYL